VTSDRKKPGLALWATVVVVVVLVGYPVNSGPAAALFCILGEPKWLEQVLIVVYTPLGWAEHHGPPWMTVLFSNWCLWWQGLAGCPLRIF
jgi:hypothetical protein